MAVLTTQSTDTPSLATLVDENAEPLTDVLPVEAPAPRVLPLRIHLH